MKRFYLFVIFVAFLMGAMLGSVSLVFAADCPDNDGDGYVVCGGCDVPAGKQCNDCNDNNAAINPGRPEICGDNIDNNCDGDQLQPGEACNNACGAPSKRVCSQDLLSLVCPVVAEGGLGGDPSTCFDNIDNDCDTFIDSAEGTDCPSSSEVCDGFDNDYDGQTDNNLTYTPEDGPSIQVQAGTDCTVSVGACARTGKFICKPGDPTSVICSVHAGSPKKEQLGFGNSCTDGVDNDCNSLTDAADDKCQVQTVTHCDDGTPIGSPGNECSVGIGPCLNTGTFVCVDDGSGNGTTMGVCNATPLPAGVEDSASCSASIDNDCDGLKGAADSSCDAFFAGLVVQCALPFQPKPGLGQPGGDCNDKHIIQYTVLANGAPFTPSSVELLGLDADGEVLGALQTSINTGEEVHTNSTTDPLDFHMVSKGGGTRHEVFAPVPLLRITARKGDVEAQAFCSNIPYLDVTKPDGAVVSVSGGDTTKVVVAIPRVRPETLFVKVDGHPILGIDPETNAPAPCGVVDEDGQFGPVSCQIDIGDSPQQQLVDVVDLRVDVALKIDQLSSNTLTMTLKNLGGGGHIVFAQALPQDTIEKDPHVKAICFQENPLKDAGTVSALEVTITDPTDQEVVTDPPPVQVTGTIKHGAHITSYKLNGKVFGIQPGQETFTEGDGENTADQYEVNFTEFLQLIDLSAAIAATPAELGTLQRGSNNLVAEANDEFGTRAFDTAIFGVGNVASPDVTAGIQAQAESIVKSAVHSAIKNTANLTTTEVQNAFVAGLEKSAVDNVFSGLCTTAVNEFEAAVKQHIQGQALTTVCLEPTCSCDVCATFVLQDIDVGTNFSCPTVFSGPVGPGGQIDVTINLPTITVVIGANRRCTTTFLGACVARTVIDIQATTIVSGARFNFTITESQIETNTPPPDNLTTFVQPVLRFPGSVPSDFVTDGNPNSGLEDDIPGIWHNDSGIECVGAAICNFFVGLGAVFAEAFTFGFADTSDFFGDVDVQNTELADFRNLAGSDQPDPFGLGNLQINKQTVANFGRGAFEPTLDKVDITGPPQATAAGVTVTFKSTFSSQLVDTTLDNNPGAALTHAAPPTIPPTLPQMGFNVFVALADDTINQLFASLAQSGGLKTVCQNTGKTIGDFLPDCETGLTATTLNLPPNPTNDPVVALQQAIIVAGAQGLCHGLKLDNCEAIPTQTGFLVPETEQGICHAVRGDDCNTQVANPDFLALLAEQGICQNFPKPNLPLTDKLLFCAAQSLPPQLLIAKPSGGNVGFGNFNTTLLLNDLSVAVVVDRGTPPNGQLDGDLKAVPNCFAANTAMNADCNLLAACVDLSVQSTMSHDATKCAPGETGFVFSVGNVTPTMNQFGYVCGVTPTQTDDQMVSTVAGTDQTIDEIKTNIGVFTPPLCVQGLDLGLGLTFEAPNLITIRTNGPDGLTDYFGIAGKISKP